MLDSASNVLQTPGNKHPKREDEDKTQRERGTDKIGEKSAKTYNSGYSPVVTEPNY
jgi:hypothetical protein